MTTALTRRPARTPLAAIRAAHGLTLKELGRLAGVTQSQIWYWERKLPSLWLRLARIADALGVPADEVLGRVPVTRPVDAVSRADRELLDAMEQDALEIFGAESVKRCGGWRRIARYKWLGHLIGARDRLLQLPPPENPAAAERVEVVAADRRRQQHQLRSRLS